MKRKKGQRHNYVEIYTKKVVPIKTEKFELGNKVISTSGVKGIVVGLYPHFVRIKIRNANKIDIYECFYYNELSNLEEQ